jgi:hypothetical protein
MLPRVKIAGKQVPLPAVLLAAAVVIALVGTAAEWAIRRRPAGPVRRKIERVRRLERKAGAGVEELLELARDRTVVPLEGRPPLPEHLIPHDTVGDLALDALRRIRTGDPEAPRLFEWCVDSGVSYEEAIEAWRAEELRRAEAWWESVKKKTP